MNVLTRMRRKAWTDEVLRFGVSGPQDRAHGPFYLLTRTENPALSVLLTGSPAPAKNENGVEITQVAPVRPRDQESLVTRWCVSNIGMPAQGIESFVFAAR